MRQKHLPISIIIPCAYDTNLDKCLASIDADVEVIVALNGATHQVRKIVDSTGVDYVEIPERNLPLACNKGVAKAKRPYIFLMNSDCTFSPNSLDNLATYCNDNNSVIRIEIEFQYDNFTSKVIAGNRSYIYNTLKKPYQPGLLISQKTISKLGYLFDEDIHWTEDADLARRMDSKTINCLYVDREEALIVHEKLSMFQDLRSARRYGVGRRIAEEKGLEGTHTKYKLFIKYNLKTFVQLSQKTNIFVAFYQTFIWSFFFTVGYLSQMFFDIYDVRRKYRSPNRENESSIVHAEI